MKIADYFIAVIFIFYLLLKLLGISSSNLKSELIKMILDVIIDKDCSLKT